AWIAWRRPSSIPLVPLMNLIVALCVLGYWVQRWYSYVFKGITWYATDQLVPAYALMALVIAALAISGRLSAPLPNWLIFGIDAIVIVAAALFFTFVRIDRLI
ncbi:MAG TPA: hypothetical protein VK636_19915, partial [Gemmatimonadaceae bacterium]|nr:hypothetical protein [Gemmatimonadaceae bacterium]